MTRRLPVRFVIASALVLASFARGGVLVVDPAGAPGAPLLQAALDAAQPGDILLIRPGDYSSTVPLVLSGKGLALVADPAGTVLLPSLHTTGLPADSTLVLRGLHGVSPPSTQGGLTLLGGGGALWIEDCTWKGYDAWHDGAGNACFADSGLFVQSFTDLVITRSVFLGGRGLDASTLPDGTPVYATGGGFGLIVAGPKRGGLHACLGEGGRGGDGAPDPFGFGTAGGGGLSISATDATLIHGGVFTGGDEGDNNDASTSSGTGAQVWFAHVALRDTDLVPGAVHGVGTVAPPLTASFSVVDSWNEPAVVLALNSPVREFGQVFGHVEARPGDGEAWLFLSMAPGAGHWAPAKQGVWSLDVSQPLLPVPLGPVDAFGALDFGGTLPALPPGIDGIVVYCQLAVQSGQGHVVLGTPSAMVWVSASL